VTYLAFLALFLAPPILLLAWANRGRLAGVHPRAARFLALVAAIALVYTTPWDNYLVWRGVWGYGKARVLGTIGWVPVEEYLFFVLQPLLTGLFLYRLLPAPVRPAAERVRWIGAGLYAAAAIAGFILLRSETGTYLGLILAWAAPVLAGQWAFAGREIWERRRAFALAVAVPTAWLWIADATAIGSGIWHISERFTLGPAVGPLPLEEAVFFLVTNLLCVQGLLLFLYRPWRREGA
jgi:lycopene beta-cyclase